MGDKVWFPRIGQQVPRPKQATITKWELEYSYIKNLMLKIGKINKSCGKMKQHNSFEEQHNSSQT